MLEELGGVSKFDRADELVDLTPNERLDFFQADGWPTKNGTKPGFRMVASVCTQVKRGPVRVQLYLATTLRDRRRVVCQAPRDAWVTWSWLPSKRNAKPRETVAA